jgi:endonuclease III
MVTALFTTADYPQSRPRPYESTPFAPVASFCRSNTPEHREEKMLGVDKDQSSRTNEGQMKRSEKAAKIMGILNELFPAPPIPLDHKDPFTLTVAVLLSAQTTDKKVNEVTPHLFKLANTPKKMAGLEIEVIRQTIRQIGLAPQKAKALKGLGQRLMEHHAGQIPADFDALIQLPGVGRKTANVVMAQAFGVPSFPVDTHIHRLAARWGLSKGKTADHTEEDLKKIFPREAWNKLHLQIIYFGREYCPARYHALDGCPICGWAATQKRIAQELKMNLPKRKRP